MLIPGPTLLTNQRIYLSDECSNQIKEVQEKENIMNQERTGFIISLLSLFFFYLLGPSTHQRIKKQPTFHSFILFVVKENNKEWNERYRWLRKLYCSPSKK
jgi:hypothetical protein